jgi:hypothetical protein
VASQESSGIDIIYLEVMFQLGVTNSLIEPRALSIDAKAGAFRERSCGLWSNAHAIADLFSQSLKPV